MMKAMHFIDREHVSKQPDAVVDIGMLQEKLHGNRKDQHQCDRWRKSQQDQRGDACEHFNRLVNGVLH